VITGDRLQDEILAEEIRMRMEDQSVSRKRGEKKNLRNGGT